MIKLKLKLSNQEWKSLLLMLLQFQVTIIHPDTTRAMVTQLMRKVVRRMQDRELKKENTLSLEPGDVAAIYTVLNNIRVSGIYEQNIIDSIATEICRYQANNYMS